MLKINIYVILEVKASTINLIKIGQSDSALIVLLPQDMNYI